PFSPASVRGEHRPDSGGSGLGYEVAPRSFFPGGEVVKGNTDNSGPQSRSLSEAEREALFKRSPLGPHAPHLPGGRGAGREGRLVLRGLPHSLVGGGGGGKKANASATSDAERPLSFPQDHGGVRFLAPVHAAPGAARLVSGTRVGQRGTLPHPPRQDRARADARSRVHQQTWQA